MIMIIITMALTPIDTTMGMIKATILFIPTPIIRWGLRA